MKDKGFFCGGTVTGRWPSAPEMQDAADRHRAKKVAHGLAQVDFRDIERRVFPALAQKIAEDALVNALSSLFLVIQDRVDEEGCGAVFAALRGQPGT